MSQIEILDMALSHIKDVLSLISDPEQVEEYKAKKAELEDLIEIERAKVLRAVSRMLEGAK